MIISAKGIAKNKTAFFIDDNMLKHLNGYGFSKLTNRRFNAKSMFHPGAKFTILLTI